MIWDFENIFLLAVVFFALLLYLWAKYYSDFELNEPKGKALTGSLVFFAIFLVCGFDITADFVTPAEIQGQVSQLRLEAGKGENSNFEVTSPNGLRVRIVSRHNFVELLTMGEALNVRYNPWTSRAYTIERLDGSKSEILLQNPKHDTIDWIVLLAAALGGIFSLRKFRLDAS